MGAKTGQNVLSEEETGWDRWCEDGTKYTIGGKDRMESVGVKTEQNILSEEGTGWNQ